MQARAHPVRPGDPAPRFSLPAVNREGTVSLEDFRERRAVLVGLFRGLHCPFCRRQLVQLAAAQPALDALGVETLAVVNTELERARFYFRLRPTPVRLLADPERRSHEAFGLPKLEFIEPGSGVRSEWPRVTLEEFQALRIDPTGELGERVQPMVGNDLLNEKDKFQLTPVDEKIFAAHGTQLAGHFLIDRGGIVRWARTEATESPESLSKFPSSADLLAAARDLERSAPG